MAEEAKWYVVHTYSGYEKKVADNIEKIIEAKDWGDVIKEIKIPTEIVTEIKNNKERKVEQKLFPSYVFIKMVLNDDTWYVVKNTRGVTGFVGAGSKPKPLTEEEMLQFGVVNEKKYADLDFSEGSKVIIVNGPLEGYEAVVESVQKDKGTAKVLVNMFGRKTAAEVEFKNLKSFTN